MTDLQSAHPNPGQWWLHRRTMAYISLLSIVSSLAAALFGDIADSKLALVEGLCWIFGFIVAAYYTGNAAEEFAKAKR